ncbi:hypothetical protein CONLIGDRAFT_679335 [Coniochaeta ligniaria NRRL 30616]|uniref:Uncharacterized protein n=1 Tax=Coniochaeta ligniaria NRRL 30616 TaxID=1408157 RepID=A0A1J7JS11_9PEZI|nr:hypothetical protein CONLIGDRAFT_679335 [Coniochaeta ligniaria NRRL 30616]
MDSGQRGFPERVRAMVDMFDSLSLDDLDPEMLRNLFASFIQMFCEIEMALWRLDSGEDEEPVNDLDDHDIEAGLAERPHGRLLPQADPGPRLHAHGHRRGQQAHPPPEAKKLIYNPIFPEVDEFDLIFCGGAPTRNHRPHGNSNSFSQQAHLTAAGRLLGDCYSGQRELHSGRPASGHHIRPEAGRPRCHAIGHFLYLPTATRCCPNCLHEEDKFRTVTLASYVQVYEAHQLRRGHTDSSLPAYCVARALNCPDTGPRTGTGEVEGTAVWVTVASVVSVTEMSWAITNFETRVRQLFGNNRCGSAGGYRDDVGFYA